ncbi:ABC transporter ATP-binding protein [Paenibacillus vulneris]|uniref:ABC transporter ATP-binding protein n=1 Tax=Paenibacillus vulneris TaxID=1133364 RepID=A0ABW3UEG8_9BACL
MEKQSEQFVIQVNNVSKLYKLYDKPIDRLKESLLPIGKKYHKNFMAVNNISFKVGQGEILGIVGKNGSGKSTLLKMITGVLTPTSGSIEIKGKISALLELGAGFNMEYTGIENIYLNGTIMGYSKSEMDSKLDEILKFADIGDFVYQPVKTYSSGMFVRLAFAVAINVDPDILIVDEALSVGDVRFQQKCYAKLESFKEAGKTILFVTHSLEAIKMYCSRAILIDNGVLKEIGAPKDVVNSYLKILRKLDIEEKNLNKESLVLSNTGDKSLQLIEDSIWYNKNEYKYGVGGARFTRIGLFDEKGNFETQYEVGSTIAIKAEFVAEEDNDQIYFGFGLRNIQGQDLVVFNGTSSFDDFPIKNVKKGKTYIVHVKLKASFVPNDYTIALSLAKIENDEIVQMQIRYDVLLYKVISSKRLYAGAFIQDIDINVSSK